VKAVFFIAILFSSNRVGSNRRAGRLRIRGDENQVAQADRETSITTKALDYWNVEIEWWVREEKLPRNKLRRYRWHDLLLLSVTQPGPTLTMPMSLNLRRLCDPRSHEVCLYRFRCASN